MRLAKALPGAMALLLLVIAPASAASHTAVSFCFNNWPPYAHLVDDEAHGLSISILREATRRAGQDASFAELPWKRCLQMVEAGEIDAVIDAADREGYIHGDVSFTVYTNTFWVRASDDVTSFEQAIREGRRLGLVSGYVYGDKLDNLFETSGANTDQSVDDTTLVRKLGFGRTGIIIADFVSTRLLARELDVDLRVLQTHSFDRLYTSFNPLQRAKMEALDAALSEMCDDGWIESTYVEMLGDGIDAASIDLACASESASKGAS